MLKISMIPVMTRMISKIDLTQTIQGLKELDIFDEGQSKLTPEQVGDLGAEILGSILPQLDKVGQEIPEFVALYKGVSINEAGEFDVLEIIEELKGETGIINFFKRALQKKVEQKQ